MCRRFLYVYINNFSGKITLINKERIMNKEFETEIINEIESLTAAMEKTENLFNYSTNNEIIESTILQNEAARKRYSCLLKRLNQQAL